ATPAPTSAVATATAIPSRRLLRCVLIPGVLPQRWTLRRSGRAGGHRPGSSAAVPGRLDDLQWSGRTERLLGLAKIYGSRFAARAPASRRAGAGARFRSGG